MSGRRIRDVVGSVMESNGFEPRVAVSGLTNEYIHYISTFEEYQVSSSVFYMVPVLQCCLMQDQDET